MNLQTLHRPRTAWHALLRGLGRIWQRLQLWTGRRSPRHEGGAVSGLAPDNDPATAQRRAREAWTALVRRRAPHLLRTHPLPPTGPRGPARWPVSRPVHAADSAGDRSGGAERHQPPSAPSLREWTPVPDSQPDATCPSKPARWTGSSKSAPGSLPGNSRGRRAAEPAPTAGGGAEPAWLLPTPPPAAGPGAGTERTRPGSAEIGNAPSRSLNAPPVAGMNLGETAPGMAATGEKRQPPACALPTRNEAVQTAPAPEASAVEEQSRSPEDEVWQPNRYAPQGPSVSAGMPGSGQEFEHRTAPFAADFHPGGVNRCVQVPLPVPPASVGRPALVGEEALPRSRDPWPDLLPDPQSERSDAGPAIRADRDRRQRLLDEQRGW